MGSVGSASDVFRAVADPTRRSMLDLLRAGERTAGELADPFDMTRPAVSQHLRVLQDAGLIRGRQEGRQRRYRINPRPLREVCAWAGRYRELVDPAGHVWRIRKQGEEQMRASRWVGGMLMALAVQAPAAQERRGQTQDPGQLALPGSEHKRLEALVGDWRLDAEFRTSPAARWEKTAGRASYKQILGGRFVTEEASIDLAGNRFEWLGIYGYDMRALKYTAVWVDNGDTGMEHAEGTMDPGAKTLVLSGEQAGLPGGQPYKWVIGFDSPSRFTIEMRMVGQGGAEFANLRIVATK